RHNGPDRRSSSRARARRPRRKSHTRPRSFVELFPFLQARRPATLSFRNQVAVGPHPEFPRQTTSSPLHVRDRPSVDDVLPLPYLERGTGIVFSRYIRSHATTSCSAESMRS